MARRSYLERVAEPLPPGQPVLFAAPRPAADSVRPAVASKAQTAAQPASPPKPTSAPSPATAPEPPPRRAAARNAVPAAPGSGPLTAVAPPAQTPSSVAAANSASSSSHPALTGTAVLPIDSAADLIPEQHPPSVVLQPHISSAASPKPVGTVPPRIHIGTIEVRTLPTPAPGPPPRPAPPQHPASHSPSGAAAAPFSRAYGWRFGLIQG
jgi:hypothetical protein